MCPRLEAVLLGAALLLTPRLGHTEDLAAPSLDARDTSVAAHAEAKRLSKAGLAAFGEARYDQAIENFRAAYELEPAPILLYNIAQAERLRGHCQDAVAGYRRFLQTEPQRGRELAEELLRELEPCPERTADSRPEAAASPKAASAASATTAPGAPSASNVDRSLRPPPAAFSTRPAPARVHAVDDKGKVLKSVLSFGSAGLLFALSGYCAWRADRAADQTSELFARGGQWNEAAAATEADGQRSSAVAWLAAGGGVAATGVGAWVLAFD